MSSPQRYALVWFLLSAALFCFLPSANPLVVHGIAIDAEGPVAEATVRGQGRHDSVLTDARGRFRLPGVPKSSIITASKAGYRIASGAASAQRVTLRLVRWPADDNEDYAWIDPHLDPKQPNNCANCHGEIYREWKLSAHANSATNPKFLHLFAGTDGKSPVQRSWNAREEHPLGAGVCANCHVPTLRSPTLDYDVRAAEGVVKSGIHCDYCHKIVAAPTDKLGTRFGRDGLQLLRPAQDDLLSFGPLDDAVRPGESFAQVPAYKESRYCASCHEGIVFGVHAYGTYTEWLDSPARKQGKQCQNCHMAPTGRMTNIAPGKGGIRRDPSTLASHHFPGGQQDMLRKSLSMEVISSQDGRTEVEIVAHQVGHRVPTGFVDRQLILVVEAVDAKGRPVDLRDGPRLPASAGKWSGMPGKLYAKQLLGENGRAPVPFWLPIEQTRDTRLVPEQPDHLAFLFDQSAQRVTVRLWYRRFWQEVADARAWDDNDTLIVEKKLN